MKTVTTINIPKIVITGGPCGGKSSAMSFLSERLTELGYVPFLVPEAPTILIKSGITPVDGRVPLRIFQRSVLDLILTLEAAAESAAIHGGHSKPIILCDRGIMDTRAYMPEEMFLDVIRERGLDSESMLDVRYLGVFHMQSAAIGAEEHYSKATNVARFETLEDARLADARTLDAWKGHPNIFVIDNEGKNFDEKLNMLWGRMCHLVATTPSR